MCIYVHVVSMERGGYGVGRILLPMWDSCPMMATSVPEGEGFLLLWTCQRLVYAVVPAIDAFKDAADAQVPYHSNDTIIV